MAKKKASGRRRTKARVAPAKTVKEKESPVARPETDESEVKRRDDGLFVVGIGASAGGLEAFEQFFGKMPSDSGMAFVLVPHLAPEHKSIMAELLKRHTAMDVMQAKEGVKIRPNTVYIIPPNRDMIIKDKKLLLLVPTESHGIRHPIDHFFRSLAADRGDRAVAIVLSGTGSEGTLGLQAVKGEGGLVLAQELKTAKYQGMPSSAIATGLVDYVLPPARMPDLLLTYMKNVATHAVEALPKKAGRPREELQKIFALIRVRTGHDFSQYKQNTIVRRIEKRMALHQIGALNDYVAYLRSNEHEVESLLNELLIRVTSFFRDPEAFDSLKKNAFPRLFNNRPLNSAIRIWVPGCSTGEEAYSLAMVALESMQESGVNLKLQIFATDIDSKAVDIARTGSYPDSIAADVSQERLTRFFFSRGTRYQVREEIREMVVFAAQDIIKDPPFSKMDLVSCRNVLIYLSSSLQEKVLPLFHYALNPEGILFLGSSETVSNSADLFSVVDKRWKIFAARKESVKRATAIDLRSAPVPQPAAQAALLEPRKPVANAAVGDSMEKLLANEYAPPCCVVNEKGDILYFHGRTGRFLEPASGKAALNIFDMAREGLRVELRTALRKAASLAKNVVFEGLQVKTNGSRKAVNLEIRYISKPEHLQGLLLVVFNEQKAPGKKGAKATHLRASAKADARVGAMEYELKSTKERLQSTIEELETSNEELKSLNEELQSSNEELQSTNEELETSREELQSVNEELETVNTELQNKIDDLSQANNDITNLLSSTQIATLFLDKELRIKRFTPVLAEIISIIQTDTGRPLSDIVMKLNYPDLAADAREVIRTLAVREKNVRHQDGRWFLTRILPYRTVEDTIDGVVVTFTDITQQQTQAIIKDSLTFTEGIVDTVREPLMILDENLRVISANRAFYRMFTVSREDTEHRLIYELGNGQWDIPSLRTCLTSVVAKDENFDDFEVEHTFPGIGRRKILLNARKIFQHGVGTKTILLAMEDVTGNKC